MSFISNIYKVIVLAIVLMAFETTAHDLRVARFRITATTTGYDFNVNFDREDILTTIYDSDKYQANVIDQISAYIDKHVTIAIDGELVAYELSEIEYTETNIILMGKLLHDLENIRKIEVSNTCLLENIEGHMNVMEFFLNDKERFFRLDKDRIKTIVTY